MPDERQPHERDPRSGLELPACSVDPDPTLGPAAFPRVVARDMLAYREIDEAVCELYRLVWDRWHPRNRETRGLAPKDVYDALSDVRRPVREIHALWQRLGAHLLGRTGRRPDGASPGWERLDERLRGDDACPALDPT